jgi:hypothetical protein
MDCKITYRVLASINSILGFDVSAILYCYAQLLPGDRGKKLRQRWREISTFNPTNNQTIQSKWYKSKLKNLEQKSFEILFCIYWMLALKGIYYHFRTRNIHVGCSWMTRCYVQRIQIGLLYVQFYERVKYFSSKMSRSSATRRSYVVNNKGKPNVAIELLVAMPASYTGSPGFKFRREVWLS